MKKGRQKPYYPPDVTKLFFKDVAQTPIVGGRNEYLPLTRRIERARRLEELSSENPSATIEKIQQALNVALDELRNHVQSGALDEFLLKAPDEFEYFIDKPEWDEPPAVAALMRHVEHVSEEQHTHIKEAAWRLYYLLALIPPTYRDQWYKKFDMVHACEHFEIIRAEYEQSKQKLVEGTMRYAIRLAVHYSDSDVPYDDLVQEGLMGLIHAVDRFEELAGGHFQSYAASWIMQRIRRYIADQSRLIRIPVHVHEVVNTIDKQAVVLRSQLGRMPDDHELYVAMEWLTADDVKRIREHENLSVLSALDQRLTEYRRLYRVLDIDLYDLPEDKRKKVEQARQAFEDLTEALGKHPDEITVFRHLGWLSADEAAIIQGRQKHKKVDEQTQKALSRRQKARKHMRRYNIANQTHHSWHNTVFTDVYGRKRPIDQYLVAPNDTEEAGDQRFLKQAIQKYLSTLKPRECEVITLRFGLTDGEERTLEAIGQQFGVTRERIRQIEAKALRKLANPMHRYKISGYWGGAESKISSIVEVQKQALLHYLDSESQDTEDTEYDDLLEKARLKAMIEQYVMQGRTRTYASGQTSSRAVMATKMLEEAGEPLHYTVIHERIIQNMPVDQHYPKERTYASLFYHDGFTLLGDGVFALATWELSSISRSGETVLHHCPQPLIPDHADGRAFFESIMVGRDLLLRRSGLTAHDFYLEMQAWAGQSDSNWQNAQSAFDAWYAAGLIDRLDPMSSNGTPVALTIPQDARLYDVRMHCLNALCRRINRMPELLLTIKQVARPTVLLIQKVLFGGEQNGFDVSYRLMILAGFEAIQRNGDEWRLTTIGETVLQNNPPQDLPDFSVIHDTLAEADDEQSAEDWEYELGLLDI